MQRTDDDGQAITQNLKSKITSDGSHRFRNKIIS